MSEFNFDKLKNLEIPDSFVTGALNVPPEKEKPAFFLLKHTKAIAFAATFVIMCALGITLFVFTQKDDVVELSQNSTAQSVDTKYSETDEKLSGIAVSPTQTTDSLDNTEYTTAIEPTEMSSNTNEPGTSTPQNTENPTQNKPQNPTQTSTQKPTQSETQKPTQTESQKPDDSNPPFVSPTIKPPPYAGETEPDTSSTPGSSNDSTLPFEPPLCINECEAYIKKDLLCGSNIITCSVSTIPNSEGNYYYPPLDAPRYEANLGFFIRDYAYIYFDPRDYITFTESGDYFFTFYNANGTALIVDTVYIEV